MIWYIMGLKVNDEELHNKEGCVRSWVQSPTSLILNCKGIKAGSRSLSFQYRTIHSFKGITDRWWHILFWMKRPSSSLVVLQLIRFGIMNTVIWNCKSSVWCHLFTLHLAHYLCPFILPIISFVLPQCYYDIMSVFYTCREDLSQKHSDCSLHLAPTRLSCLYYRDVTCMSNWM